MAATSTCVVPIKGTHFRIVALDACGIPVTGAGGLVAVTNCFVSVEWRRSTRTARSSSNATPPGSRA